MTTYRRRALQFVFLAILTCSLAQAQDVLPPRSDWRASSSAVENPALASSLAIDGNTKTRWGGPFSAGHWFQLDLGRPAPVGGLMIQWDSGYAAAYTIEASLDGREWRTVFDTNDSPGDLEYIFFPSVTTRYLRLASKPRTADWMASMFEFEPIAAADVPKIHGVTPAADAASLWSGNVSRTLDQTNDAGARELRIDFPKPMAIAGLQVFWETPRASARLEGRQANREWRLLWEDPEPLGETSFLSAPEAQTVNELRLLVRSTKNLAPAIRRLRLLSPSRVMTPLKRYEIVASRANRELFPATLHRQQVYWTVIGIPAGVQKSVLDEYGNLEAFKGAPLVQPLWRDDAGKAVAAPTVERTHALREGWMPMPTVRWQPQAGLELFTDAFTLEHRGLPLTLTRYRLHNSGTSRIQGRLSLLVRPLQVNPQWQHGGVAPIRRIAIEGPNERTAVTVNGRVLMHSLSPVDARGAAGFGRYGETEITRHVAAGTVPQALSAEDSDGLAAAQLVYRIELAPGAKRDVVVAFPLDNQHVDLKAEGLPPAPAIDREVLLASSDAAAAFETQAAKVADAWRSRIGQIQLSLPNRDLVDMLRAQVAYMLINQTGNAMQPGPRNYNRSFIRDGSASAVALARMGMTQTARDFLKWYSDHAVHPNGLVSPILNEDGTVNRGFGSDLEHDSQGQFIWLVAEIARVDGGPASVRDYHDKVRRAMRFMEELRNRTLASNYAADREAPERFRGLIAPSISHEGYSVPTHSYWDDFFALKGWRDGAWLAEGWGDKALASYARKQYELLRESVKASIVATMKWKQIEFIPGSADLADWDATSVSIGIDPAGQIDILPPEGLRYTFDRYLNDIRSRDVPNALYAYTPYEMRNVLTYVHLDRPEDASEVLMNLFRHRRPAPWHVLAEVVHSRERHDGYLGDMPHTWIGSEYVRAIFGMLMRESEDRMHLLPGAPPSWLEGNGVRMGKLPTAFGELSLTARQEGSTLRMQLQPGLRSNTKLQVVWPNRQRPNRVTVDGRDQSNYSASGIMLDRPFRELVAEW